MNNLIVNITVNDCLSCKCNSNNCSITQNIASTSEFIPLQCGYYIKFLSITSTYIIISIDNGNVFFVRRLYIGVPIKLNLPNNCACHILNIQVNSITT